MSSEARFVGLDAGRDGIEAWIRPTGEVWKMDAGEAGMTRAAETLSRLHPQLVVMQANGNFELPMAGILVTFGLPVALVQPRNVRDFARAIGRSSRTEQRQAGLLAQFAELVQPDANPVARRAGRGVAAIKGTPAGDYPDDVCGAQPSHYGVAGPRKRDTSSHSVS